MTDLMQRLADARPGDDELAVSWPDTDRERVLAGVRRRAEPTPRLRRRTPWLAAAAVAGLCALPLATSVGDSSAQALTDLASVAAAQSGPMLAPGTFLHVKTESLQENSSIFGDGDTLDTNREAWVGWDGRILAIDTRPSAGWREYHEFERTREVNSINGPTPEFAASLPATEPELAAYLEENVSGSNSHEEAMFVAVADLARSNFLPPETLSAALLVLADVDGVRVEDVVIDGRAAVEVSYQAWWARLIASHTVTIDKATARVVSERKADPTGSYRSDTVLTEVVTEVPDDVLAAFAEHEDGERVYD